MNETLYRWTFKFHKVVRQQNSDAVEDFISPYSAVYLRIQKWKNYWNRSTFANVIVKIKVARFLWPTVYFYYYCWYKIIKILLIQVPMHCTMYTDQELYRIQRANDVKNRTRSINQSLGEQSCQFSSAKFNHDPIWNEGLLGSWSKKN